MWLYFKALLHWYSLYMVVLGSLVYVLYLIDGAWLSGSRAWLQLRTLKLWRKLSPARFYFPNSLGGGGETETPVFGVESAPYKKYIFVVIPNNTNMPLFWGFGFHGARFAPQIRIRYLLPAILFYVPFLRDVLMWSGAVAYRKEDQWATMNDLLNRGYSVAYASNGMTDAFTAYQESRTGKSGEPREVQAPADALFDYAKAENVALVPVLVNGEAERYVFAPQPGFIVSLQQFCYKNWGYPFPVVCLPTRQSQIHLQFCSVLQPHLFEKAAEMKDEFLRAVKSANNTGADRRIVFTYASE